MAIRMALVVTAAHAALKSQVAKIDSLNVYPVPDGDTGTNMLLTLESVLRETSDETYETPEAASKAPTQPARQASTPSTGRRRSGPMTGA